MKLSKRHTVGAFTFVSQDPGAIKSSEALAYSVDILLPSFVQIWRDIEEATGYRWKCTSYIRASPSHEKGHAFDLAPDIAPSARQHYSVYRKSDPVLYKREPLIRALQSLTHNEYGDGTFRLGVFIEPDHLHIQALHPDTGGTATPIVKWKIAKIVYPDTFERMELPMITN